jgi:hypothetical protein
MKHFVLLLCLLVSVFASVITANDLPHNRGREEGRGGIVEIIETTDSGAYAYGATYTATTCALSALPLNILYVSTPTGNFTKVSWSGWSGTQSSTNYPLQIGFFNVMNVYPQLRPSTARLVTNAVFGTVDGVFYNGNFDVDPSLGAITLTFGPRTNNLGTVFVLYPGTASYQI